MKLQVCAITDQRQPLSLTGHRHRQVTVEFKGHREKNTADNQTPFFPTLTLGDPKTKEKALNGREHRGHA